MPSRTAYLSAVLALPDGAVGTVKNELAVGYAKVFGEEGSNIFLPDIPQKIYSEPTQNKSYNTDLKITPSDILVNMEKVKSEFTDGTYGNDGDVIEKNFVKSQATDSYGDVYVRNVTKTKEIDIKNILSESLDMKISDCTEPTVLIFHTHTTESYLMTDLGYFSSEFATRSSDKNVNMVRVGDEITNVLEANGIGVIHDTEIHDASYTGAYKRSRVTVDEYLKKYPSIKITLDIHRDAIYYDDGSRVKPVSEIDGKKASQLMIIAGAEDGDITGFPSWETNLKFAVNIQKNAQEKYPSLMKPIYFCCRKYNMDATPYSLLIEVGTDANTLEESAYSGRLLGDVLSDMIKNKEVSK